jgi:hypothetical protein
MGSMAGLRHTVGVLLVVVLAASGTMRGLCFMPGTGEAGPRDAHACCKKGWTARPPECCMNSMADEDPGRTVVAITLAPPATAAAPGAPWAHPVPGRLGLDARARSHSPPGLAPLRI